MPWPQVPTTLRGARVAVCTASLQATVFRGTALQWLAQLLWKLFKHALHTLMLHHPCCRGSTDEFAIQDRELGMLEAVTVGHDGSGLKPAWHLQQVAVTNSNSGQEWLFPCRQWFDADSGDRKIERRLQEGR